MERQLAQMQSRAMELIKSEPDRLEEFLEQGFPPEIIQAPAGRPQTPLERAQDLAWDAFDAGTVAERIRLAHEALRLSSDCADAYVILGGNLAKTAREALTYYDLGIAAGRRALGGDFFEENIGAFWGILETRPLMRAMEGRFQALVTLKRHHDAIETAQAMLELNPDDNQGVRYSLMTELVRVGDDDGLRELVSLFPEEYSAYWLFSQTLAKFRAEGDGLFTRRSLTRSHASNPYVADYLLGRQQLPVEPDPFYSFGDETEATWYASEQKVLWRNTPGALEWLRHAVPFSEKDPQAVGERHQLPGGDGPNFVFNSLLEYRWSRCMVCETPTRKRMAYLTVLLDPDHLANVRVACRYCPHCDLLIAHADDVVQSMLDEFNESQPDLIGHDFVIRGTIDSKKIRQRPGGEADAAWIDENTINFREIRPLPMPWTEEEFEEIAEEFEYLMERAMGPAEETPVPHGIARLGRFKLPKIGHD